jgi:hypothetical protein
MFQAFRTENAKVVPRYSCAVYLLHLGIPLHCDALSWAPEYIIKRIKTMTYTVVYLLRTIMILIVRFRKIGNVLRSLR